MRPFARLVGFGFDTKKVAMGKLLAQIMKFGVVGVIATVIDFGVMNLLHYGLHLDILIANTSGFVISLIFNYLASMKYVFAHKEGMSLKRRHRARAQRTARLRGEHRQDLRHGDRHGLQLRDAQDLPRRRRNQVIFDIFV